MIITLILICIGIIDANAIAQRFKVRNKTSSSKPMIPGSDYDSISADLDDNGVLTIVFSEPEGMATIRVKDSNNIIIEEFSATTFLPIAIYLDQSSHYQIIEITTNQGSYEASIINP